jgi:spore coat protein U-like protein
MRTLLAALFLLLLSAAAARAQSCTGTVSDVNFGAPDLLAGTAVDVTATLSVNCTGLVGSFTHQVCLSLGTGSGGRTSPWRLMSGPTATQLRYNLYGDPARTQEWGGRGTFGTMPGIPVTRNSPSGSTTIYARFAPSQTTAPPGAYSAGFSGGNATVFMLDSTSTDCGTGTVQGSSTTAAFTVSAAPAPTCELTVQNVNFGARGVLSTTTDASAPLTARCTSTTPYTVGLNGGLANAAPAARKMFKGSETVTYGLYRDAARSQGWGEAAGATASGSGTGSNQSFTIFGRVPAQATPSPGAYSDTVVATVTY